jgi:hypothetical protein
MKTFVHGSHAAELGVMENMYSTTLMELYSKGLAFHLQYVFDLLITNQEPDFLSNF